MSVSAKRAARIDLTANTAGMDRGLGDARRKLRTFEREQARAAKHAEREAKRTAKAQEKARAKSMQNIRGGVAQGFGQVLGLGALGGIQGVLEDVQGYERALTRLEIASESTPQTMREFSAEITKASQATGVNRSEILGAATAYVTLTGDMKTARDQSTTFAKTAQATGASMEDLSKMAAAGAQNLGIQGKEFETFFSGMAAQGKSGAIELKDIAAELSTIAPQWAQFTGGKGLQGARQLGAAMQVVKKGFGGDSGETTAGLSNFLTAITKKASRFEGLNFFNTKTGADGKKRKELKDVYTILDLISKSKIARDPELLTKAFGSIEAYRAYIQLRDNRGELERLAKVGQDAGMIQRDYDKYMASSAGRTAKAWTNVKNAVAEAFTPERIDGFVAAIEGIIPAVAGLVTLLSKVGEGMGAIFKAGQDIRGALTGEGHITWIDEQMAKAGSQEHIRKIDNLKGQANYAKIKAADSPQARAFLGINAGSSTELARQYSQAEGPGAVAKRTAAEKYFKETGTMADPWAAKNEAGDAAKGPMAIDSAGAKSLAADIAKAIREGFDGMGLKIGSESIQKAGANSISHRRGGR